MGNVVEVLSIGALRRSSCLLLPLQILMGDFGSAGLSYKCDPNRPRTGRAICLWASLGGGHSLAKTA